MGNALIKQINGRAVMVPLTNIRIATHIGTGDVRYLTSDGWVGVHVDGDPERRVDEIHVEHLATSARAQLADPIVSRSGAICEAPEDLRAGWLALPDRSRALARYRSGWRADHLHERLVAAGVRARGAAVTIATLMARVGAPVRPAQHRRMR